MAGKFEPKESKHLDPPRDDPIAVEELALCNGQNPDKPTYVAIKGRVYDVTGNKAYGPEGSYKVFAGHDASRALAKSSTDPKDVSPIWDDLNDSERKVLDDWIIFFSKRYNIVGRVVR